MPDRPYTLLSCSVSLDGYLGDLTPRLALSNDGRLRPGRRGARLVRRDHGRRGHRAHRQPAAARALARTPRGAHGPRAPGVAEEDHRHQPGGPRRTLELLHHRRGREARLHPEPACGRRARPPRAGGDDRGRRPARAHAPAQRGPRRSRRGAAHGRGRRHRAHAVPGRRPRRRAAARRRALLRRRLERPALRERRALPVERRAGARRSPRCARSATSCCCATRSHRGSGTNERRSEDGRDRADAQVLLLAVLAATAGLGAAGWSVGVAARDHGDGARRAAARPAGPASWVTLARARSPSASPRWSRTRSRTTRRSRCS